jgi:Flp pilus assembly pilin Flp
MNGDLMKDPRTQFGEELAQGIVEYVLILVFIALAVFAVMSLLGTGMANTILQDVIGAF